MNGLKYWDPAESMYNHALEITCGNAPGEGASDEDIATYNTCKATITTGTGGNYFSIASVDIYGSEQNYQFQTGETATYSWSDHATGSWPRSHLGANQFIGSYFNWYAANAETTNVSMGAGGRGTDSVCPSGWQLPSYYTFNKSYEKFAQEYSIVENDVASSNLLRKTPMSFVYGGYYYQGQNYVSGVNGAGNYYKASAVNNYAGSLLLIDTNVNVSAFSYRLTGLSVRCVKK